MRWRARRRRMRRTGRTGRARRTIGASRAMILEMRRTTVGLVGVVMVRLLPAIQKEMSNKIKIIWQMSRITSCSYS